jgi:hypothetical protein
MDSKSQGLPSYRPIQKTASTRARMAKLLELCLRNHPRSSLWQHREGEQLRVMCLLLQESKLQNHEKHLNTSSFTDFKKN